MSSKEMTARTCFTTAPVLPISARIDYKDATRALHHLDDSLPPYLSSTLDNHRPYAHWDPVRRCCWRFPQKTSWLMIIVLSVSRLKLTSVCNPPVNFSCFLQNQPQNQPLCKNHAIIVGSRGRMFFSRSTFCADSYFSICSTLCSRSSM